MKLLIKLCLVLLVVAVFLPFWLKGPDGEPIMTLDDWVSIPGGMQGVLDKAGGLLGEDAAVPGAGPVETPAPAGSSGEFYRWQDERGVWHFSDRAPEGQQAMAAENLPELRNRMDRVEIPEDAPERTGATGAMGSTIDAPLPEGVSKEAIEEMLQDAHEKRMGEHL